MLARGPRSRILLMTALIGSALLAGLGGFLVPFIRDAARDGDEGRATVGIVVALLVAAALVLATGVVVPQVTVRPFRRLRTAATALVRGEGTAPLRLSGPQEVRDLGGAFNDLADTLRQQLAAAAAERERLEQTLAASADVVVAVDREGRVVYANRAATTALTAAPKSAVGQPLLSVLFDHEVYELVSQALRGQEATPQPVRRDGRQFQATAKPVSGGGLWAAVLVMHDVTAMHAAEAARREFVANVSHELRTPLAAISAAVETLEQGVAAADAKRFHAIIGTESDRMAALVEEMLELARLESGLAQPQPRRLDLRAAVQEAVGRLRPQAERAGLTLSVSEPAEHSPAEDRPAEDMTVNADPDLAQRALVNLLQNAIKFTPAPGEVTLSLRAADEVIWLQVRDTGIGLSVEDQARIFQRFYRADRARQRAGGTGLGLALVRHIAEAHGGSVMVESELGAGSTFGFSLPRQRPSSADVAESRF